MNSHLNLGHIKTETGISENDENNWDDPFRDDEDDDQPEDEKEKTKRKSRNQSEKKRRDQFNILINELMTLVAGTNRKMDKSTVLQATISFLKRNKEMSSQHTQQEEVTENWKPSYISNAEFSQLMLEALDGFLVAIAKSGQVIYCSDNVTPVLGHTPESIMNESFFQFIHEAERSEVYAQLSKGQAVETVNHSMSLINNGESYPVPQGIDNTQLQFKCHIRRGNAELDNCNEYEQCRLSGTFRRYTQNSFCGLSNLMDINNDDSVCFVGVCRLVSPLYVKDIAITDKNAGEFGVRLSLDGKFVHVEGKTSASLGYSSLELMGRSYFEFVHTEDLEKIESSFGKLSQCGEIQSQMYRLMTKGRHWIWVQPRLYLQYHQWSRKAESINVTHYVVTYQDVLSQLTKEKKMKERERSEMKVMDAAKANQIAAINAAVKFELKDMQLPAITIGGDEGEKVNIPKFGEEINEGDQTIEKVREESKRKENQLMDVIAQYEDELKKVKEELHIYQRREKSSGSIQPPLNKQDHIPSKHQKPNPERTQSVISRMPNQLQPGLLSMAGLSSYGLSMNPALKNSLTGLGIPIPNLTGFNPQMQLSQLNIPHPNLQPPDLSALYNEQFQNQQHHQNH